MIAIIKFLRTIDKCIEKFSKVGLLVSVLGMLFISILTIVLRWVNVPLLWADPLVRHLVFLCAFLGGALATGGREHIGIDILGKYLESRGREDIRKHVLRVLDVACVGIVIWLMMASVDFTVMELKHGPIAFLGIHSGVLVGIIPFGLAMICYRFFYLFVSSFFDLDQKEST